MMLHQTKSGFRKKQCGVSLLELLIVISIVGILAYAAIPQFSEIVEQRDLNTGSNTLMKALHKAKSIARAQNTIVDVSIANNEITIAPQNTTNSQTLRMPAGIIVTSDTNLSFNSMGLAMNENQIMNVQTDILIQPNANDSLNQTISISITGMIASL